MILVSKDCNKLVRSGEVPRLLYDSGSEEGMGDGQ